MFHRKLYIASSFHKRELIITSRRIAHTQLIVYRSPFRTRPKGSRCHDDIVANTRSARSPPTLRTLLSSVTRYLRQRRRRLKGLSRLDNEACIEHRQVFWVKANCVVGIDVRYLTDQISHHVVGARASWSLCEVAKIDGRPSGENEAQIFHEPMCVCVRSHV